MTRRTYQRHDIDDEDAYDENGILKDGHALVVPLRMMDAMQKDIHEHFSGAKITDGAFHKPGFRVSATVTRDRSIYDSYDAEVASAYKNVGAVESEVRGQREGDSCTVKSGQGLYGPEGSPGHLQMVEGELVCVADSKLSDAMRDEREATYQAYQNRIQNAWRDGR